MLNKIKEFYRTKRAQKIAVSVLAIMVILGGVIFTLTHKSATSKVDVSITLTSKDITEKTNVDVNVIVNADVEILATDGSLVEDLSMLVNEPKTLQTQLELGEYKIHMTSAPIESDGSMYKIPSKIDNLVISDEDIKNKNTINVEVPLERIAVADMTKEQLEIAIERINKETPDENKDLIDQLKKRQETAVSDKASVKDVQQESKADDTPKEEAKPSTPDKPSSGGSSGGNSGGGSTISGSDTSNKHEHSWTPRMITVPAVPAQGYNETIPAVTKNTFYKVYADGCKILVGDADASKKHINEHGMMNYREEEEVIVITPESTRWVETAPAQPAYQKQDGYLCSCGAYKNR